MFSIFKGDVKNLKLTVGLNHYQAATIMSSFPNNMATFPNHNISEFPFNDSIRCTTSSLFYHFHQIPIFHRNCQSPVWYKCL